MAGVGMMLHPFTSFLAAFAASVFHVLCWLDEEIEFDAASNPYIATSTTAECLALIFMIVVGDPRG